MERKAIIIKGEGLKTLNAMLSEGWEVEHISTFTQEISNGQGYGIATDLYGAYVILKRKKQELTEDEVKAILATKGIMEDIWEQ